MDITEITAGEKRNFRELALKSAQMINPYRANQIGGLQGERSVSEILRDAQTIYEWLLKDS